MTRVTGLVVPLRNVPRGKDRRETENRTRRLTVEGVGRFEPMVVAFTEVLHREVLAGIRAGLPGPYRIAHRRRRTHWNSAALAWDSSRVRVVRRPDESPVGGHFKLHGPVFGGLVSRTRYATWRMFKVLETDEQFVALALHPAPSGERRGRFAHAAGRAARRQAERVVREFVDDLTVPVMILGDLQTASPWLGSDIQKYAYQDPIIRAELVNGLEKRWARWPSTETVPQRGSDHPRFFVEAVIRDR